MAILRQFGGANDVATGRMRPERVNSKLDWSLSHLALYRNSTLNVKGKTLYHTKSLNLVALSRPAVEFISKQLNLTILIDQLERGKYGMDEALFSTLNSNLPDMPGGFTTQCLRGERKMSARSMGRFVIWRAEEAKCRSRRFRHTVCIFGAEDLHHLRDYALVPHLYFNKILPVFDYGAAYCWLEDLAQRSKAAGSRSQHRRGLNLSPYANLPHVCAGGRNPASSSALTSCTIPFPGQVQPAAKRRKAGY